MPSQNIPRGLIALITTERGLDREVEQFFRNIGGKTLTANVSIDELYALLTNSPVSVLDDRAEELTRKSFQMKEDFTSLYGALERRLEVYYSEIEELKQQIEDLKRSL